MDLVVPSCLEKRGVLCFFFVSGLLRKESSTKQVGETPTEMALLNSMFVCRKIDLHDKQGLQLHLRCFFAAKTPPESQVKRVILWLHPVFSASFYPRHLLLGAEEFPHRPFWKIKLVPWVKDKKHDQLTWIDDVWEHQKVLMAPFPGHKTLEEKLSQLLGNFPNSCGTLRGFKDRYHECQEAMKWNIHAGWKMMNFHSLLRHQYFRAHFFVPPVSLGFWCLQHSEHLSKEQNSLRPRNCTGIIEVLAWN